MVMLALLLVFSVCANELAAEICHVPAFPACDSKIIEKIEAQWGSKTPSNILKHWSTIGKQVLLGSTENYFSNCTEQCFLYFTLDEEDSVVAVMEAFVVTYLGCLTSDYRTLVEDCGFLYDPVYETRIYYVHQDCRGHVAGAYVCSDSEDAVTSNKPVGFIKSKAHSYSQPSVAKAYKALLNLDINISKWYTDHLIPKC